jgi:hypothetical protein
MGQAKMDKAEQIRQFDKLIPKAAKVHPRWCFKENKLLLMGMLKGKVCYNCQHYVLNGGICDPL